MVRFRRQVGHEPRLSVIPHYGLAIVESDVGDFKIIPTVVPNKEMPRPRGRQAGERIQRKDVMNSRKPEIRDMRWD